jgi:aspartyl-tRNA(Asn)/glutamyl-tRNA(Gln) amidotransferase subunit C
MRITPQQVYHVADLARLELDPAAVDKFAAQIGTILDYIDTLAQVDTQGVPATAHAVTCDNRFREDRPSADSELPDYDRESLSANAPHAAEGFFVVPKVIG